MAEFTAGNAMIFRGTFNRTTIVGTSGGFSIKFEWWRGDDEAGHNWRQHDFSDEQLSELRNFLDSYIEDEPKP